MTEPIQFKYRAFLSYSHRDQAWAKWLHSGLEHYHIDKDLVGRETPAGRVPQSLRPIFRDRDDFSAGHSLNDQTLAALAGSEFLIALCSPNAAASQYVNEEIRQFKAMGRADRVIAVIVDGEPGDPTRECFPPGLRFKLGADGMLTDTREEPIAADARAEADGKAIALQKVVAGLLGLRFDEIVRRAERARKRRNRFWAGLAGLFLLLAIAATASAVLFWKELKTNETLLSGTLKSVTEMVNQAVAQAEDYAVPRSVTLGLLRRAESLIEMAEAARPTPELRHRKAWMLIAFARNYAVLGDTASQRARAVQALQLMQNLAAEAPSNPAYQRDLSLALDQVGDVLMVQENLAEALKSYSDSLAIRRRLAQAEPENPRRQRALSLSYIKVGEVLKAQGNLPEALKSYRDGLAIRERQAQTDSGTDRDKYDVKYDIGQINERIGNIQMEQGDLAAALISYRARENIISELVNANQESPPWRRDMAVSLKKIGDVLKAQGQLDEALKSYRESLKISTQLVREDRQNATWQNDVGISIERIGDVQMAQGDLAGALKSYRARQAIISRLAEKNPSNASWQRDLSVSYETIGDVLKAQGHLQEALKSYRDSFNIRNQLTRDDSGNTVWQRDLSVSYAKIALLLASEDNLAEALEYLRASLAIRERLAISDPSNAQWQADLAEVYNNICGAQVMVGQLEAALANCTASLQLQPSANALDNRGFIYLKSGALDNAIADYDVGLRIDPKLAASLFGRGIAKQRKGDMTGGNADIAAAKAIEPEIAEEFERYGVK